MLFQKSRETVYQEWVRDTAEVVRQKTGVCSERQALLGRRGAASAAGGEALDKARAERNAAETTDAIAAAKEGRPLPDLATFDARVRQAELVKNTADKLTDDARLAAEIAADELEEALQTQRRAEWALAAHQRAEALATAIPFDEKLRQNGAPSFSVAGLPFSIADLVETSRAEAEEYAQPLPPADIALVQVNARETGYQRCLRPPDRAIEDVAWGSWEFANARDARKYASQVEALRAAKPMSSTRAHHLSVIE